MPLSARVGEPFSLVPRLLGLGPRTSVGHGPSYDTATGLPRHGHWPARSRPRVASNHVQGTCQTKTAGRSKPRPWDVPDQDRGSLQATSMARARSKPKATSTTRPTNVLGPSPSRRGTSENGRRHPSRDHCFSGDEAVVNNNGLELQLRARNCYMHLCHTPPLQLGRLQRGAYQ